MAVENQDIASVGRALFREEIEPKVEATQKGKFVVIDVNSGDYEIADDDLTATLRLTSRRPDAITWAERIGYPAQYFIRALSRASAPKLKADPRSSRT